jgi:tetratricopeptide (TPR) repeat protein
MDDRPKDDEPGSARTFVGRERELAELRTGLADVTSGRGRVGGMFLISGEPGIGKTRLADELAGEAASRGMRVVWGRCWEGGGAPAYWPWIQVIRGCLNSADAAQRRVVLESEHASSMVETVAQIVPELHAFTPRPLRPAMTPRPDPPQTQFRLFDSVATLLKDFARLQPLLVLIDDLHDADYASLMMLRLIAQGLAGTGILIVGTHRDLEVRRSPELSKHIGDLGREARSLSLAGLSPCEVAQFVELRSRQKPEDKLISRLHAATAGNPLFVDGVVRALMGDRNAGPQVASNDQFKIPDNVREAIRRRLAMLSDEAHSLLKVAAAIGNEFEAELCLRVGEVSRDELNSRLDEATTSGITISLGNSRYRFAHALVRGAVYDALDTNTRVRLHGRLAETIEEIHAKDLKAHLAELAHHFREAGVLEKAIEYSNRAAWTAQAVFAYADAAMHWREALALSEGQNDARRAGMLHALGSATAFSIDQAAGARLLEEALLLYRELGAEDKIAEANVALGVALVTYGFNVPRSLEYFRKAQKFSGVWPNDRSEGWIYHGIALAYHQNLQSTDDGIAAAAMAKQVRLRVGNPEWMSAAAVEGQLLQYKGRLREAMAAFHEAWTAVQEITDPEVFRYITWMHGSTHIALRDPIEAIRLLTIGLERKGLTPLQLRVQKVPLAIAEIMRGNLTSVGELGVEREPGIPGILAYHHGDFECTLQLLLTGLEKARRGSIAKDETAILSTLAEVEYAQENFEQAEEYLRQAMRLYDPGDLFFELRNRPEAALSAIALGRLEEAVQHMKVCRAIIAQGEDWLGRAGLVERAEGVLAAAQRRNFAPHFEKSVAILKRYCLPWDEADTLYHWGLALNAAGEHAQVNEKLDGAIEIYRRHGGGQRWIDRVEAARASMPAAQESQPSATLPGPAIFGREGDFWTITHRGRTFRLRNFKGLTYIAYLLAHPGVRIHVFDLVAMVDGGGVGAPAGSVGQARADGLDAGRDLGDVGEALDPQAIAEYRSRLAEVRAEIAEAQTNNDPGALGRARYEFDLLSNQLTAGVGRSGRARRSSSHVERARAQVTKSIRASVAHIRRNDAKLGDHFATSIRTGAFCAYLPNLANLAELADLENKPS